MKVKSFLLVLCLLLLTPSAVHSQSWPIGDEIPGARIDWNPNGLLLAIGRNHDVVIIDAVTQQPLNTLPTFADFVNDVKWSPDGDKLAVAAGFDIHIWNQPWSAGQMQLIRTLQAPTFALDIGVISIDWNPDFSQNRLLGVSPSRVHIWDTSTGELIQTFLPDPTPQLAAVWSPDGTKVALGDITGGIYVHDFTTGEGEFEEVYDHRAIYSFAWNPDGSMLAAGTGSGFIKLLSLEPFLGGAGTLDESTQQVVALAWNPTDDQLLASGSADGRLLVWSLAARPRRPIYDVQQNSPIPSVVWSPDGTQLAYSGEDGVLEIVPAPDSSLCVPFAPSILPTYTVAAGDLPGLIAAISAANANPDPDIIALGEGTYTLTAADNVLDGPNGLPAITTPITFHGHCATIERDPTADAFRFFNVQSSGSLALYDLTLTGGSSGASDGGAIDAHGPVAVTNTTFANNSADDGGAIAIDDGTLAVSGSTFTNNTAASNGGAIDLDDTATGQVVDSTFSSNSSTGDGGAIYTTVALDIQDSQFTGNTTGEDGGAVSSLAGALTVTGSTFDGNTAATNGGAIETDPAVTLTLTGCTFTANATGTDGGAVGSQGGTVTVTGCTFTGNTAGDDGGALASQGGVLTVSDSILNANTASLTSGKGGGLYVNTGSLAMTDVIFSDNTVYNGGGLYFSSGGGTAQITGTDFGNNTAGYRGGGLYLAAGNVTLDGATVTLNTAENGSGGGLYNTANLAVTGASIIASNTAAGNGGGIWNSAALTVSDSTLSQNVADPASGKGGGVYSVGGSVVVSASDLSGNQAYYGGGVYVGGGTVSLSALLSDNVAGNDGGGVYVVAGAGLMVDASTFDGNTASDDGGGLANKGAFTITHSQFLANSAGDGGAVHTSTAGSNALTHPCFSGNTATGDTGGVRSLAASLSATGSWWGAADGPSGAGPGSGDAVNANVTYTPFLTEGCPGDTGAGAAAAAAALQPSIAVLEQQAAQLDTAQFLPVTTAAALPFAPSLEDEALWQVSGAWDLARLPDRGRFGWAADATPRAQTSVLELLQPVTVDRRARPPLVVSQHLALAGADTLFIEVLPSGSAAWVVVDTQTGATAGWVRHSVDLAAFRGQTVRLRFRLVTGEDQPSEGVSLGVWLDDIAFQRP